ncbi:MAG: winged helix-turn-helix domain-containing protein [Phycisphaerales bacterium]|nr:winged helix-turn-helix domain-containing protein [Phycisphaerales bacterium]
MLKSKTTKNAKKTTKKTRSPKNMRVTQRILRDIDAAATPSARAAAAAKRAAMQRGVGGAGENDTTANTPAEAVETGNLAEDIAPATKKKTTTPKPQKPQKTSGLDAAYEVLKASGEPMSSQAIVDAMLAQGLWKTTGKTPAGTIYSAMIREIDDKPGESRFTKTGRGLFAAVTKN